MQPKNKEDNEEIIDTERRRHQYIIHDRSHRFDRNRCRPSLAERAWSWPISSETRMVSGWSLLPGITKDYHVGANVPMVPSKH